MNIPDVMTTAPLPSGYHDPGPSLPPWADESLPGRPADTAAPRQAPAGAAPQSQSPAGAAPQSQTLSAAEYDLNAFLGEMGPGGGRGHSWCLLAAPLGVWRGGKGEAGG